METPALRPSLRGVSHQYAFFIAVVAGAALVVVARGTRETVAAAVFATALAVMFGTSAVYHRVLWGPRARRWMRRADHAAIYLLIGGTYTPFGLLLLDGAWRVSVLAIAWSGCLAAILVKLFWVDAPKWLAAVLGIGLGWVGVAAMPEVLDQTRTTGIVLLALGGLLYTIGAVVYAVGRPNPVPAVFGYHELFHALTVAAAACQYVAIAFFVLPEA